MERSICISCLFIFIGIPLQARSEISYDVDTKRHHIYWDHKESKRIRDPEFALHVEMGQFMDIICPFRNGFGDNPESPAVFDLYNVTKDGFHTCNPKAPGSVKIFSCDLPDQENKLTVKFQRISPSPFGFRFRHCEEYYFIAIKRESTLAPPRGRRKYGCSRESERLRIVVGCPHHKRKSTPPVKMTSTPYTSEKQYPMLSDDNSVVEPDIKPIPDESDPKQHELPNRAESRDPGRNGSPRTAPINFLTNVMVTLAASLWILKQCTTSP